MAMVRLMFLVLSLAWVIPRDCAGQRYAVLAPYTVRPHTTYDLVVTNLEPTEQKFLFEIVNANETIVGTSSVTVSPYNLQKVQMPLEGLENRNYKLNVWKDKKQALINATDLEYFDRSYLVLFQTDKPAYKPGDKVQFRVVFLLPNAYPVVKTALPSIFITDPEKFRIKQWTNASLTSGVFEGSFQLAEYTTLGLWTISATLNQQHYKDVFRVEEYTLPLFKIQIQPMPKSYFHCENAEMVMKVIASFANGCPVRGNATIVVRANYNNYLTRTTEVARREIPIDGVADVTFRTDIVAKNCDDESNVWFDVTVTERSTGVSYNVTSAMKVRNTADARMEVLDRHDAFYPGFPMRLKVKLTTLDAQPLANQSVTVMYKVQDDPDRDIDTVTPITIRKQTNRNGIFKFMVNTTLETVEVNVDAIYNNQTFPLVFAYPKYKNRNVEYLVADARKAYYVINDNITLDVYSNVAIQRIYYIGYCSGIVCVNGVQESANPVRNHLLTLTSKPVMKPRMTVLLFTVMEDGKTLSTTIVIRILTNNNTPLNITSPPKKKNAREAVFNIIAESDAYVGLLGVDERVLQRTTANNDITQLKLEAAIRSDMDATGVTQFAYDSFASVGVTLLSDGYLPSVGLVPHWFGELERSGKISDDEYDWREDFPETWIWQSLKVSNGQETFMKTLPDTITTWVVNGFSVGPVNGMQILKQPLQITWNKTIFAQLYMPLSIKRLEQVTVHCLVHNHGKMTTVLLEVNSMNFNTTTLILAKGATVTVPVVLHSAEVGKLAVEVVLRKPNRDVIDVLRQTISVRPEGLMKTVEDVRVLDFPKPSQMHFNLSLPVIEEVGSMSSEVVTLSVIGTFLNLDSFDLEQMVKSSHGNGEENLLFLQTTMAVYEYLRKVNHLSVVTKEKFHSYMEVAYQQLLRYRMQDGSYSMFASLYECGGVWFTASTVESLRKLSRYIAVDNTLLTDGLDWLEQQSESDGSFTESCTIVHPHLQRTGGKELSLASSVLFAFLGGDRDKRYEQLVNKTLALLRSAPSEDVYLLAKRSYLLALMDHPDSVKMIEKLNKKAVTDANYRYWRVLNREPIATATLRDQETTAYALLANIKRNTIDQPDMIRVAQWLQKHSFAGNRYVPSLERIIALEALSMVAGKIPTPVPNMNLEAKGFNLTVNSTNQQLFQSVILPNNVRSVRVTAKGSGLALVKLSYRYSPSNVSANIGNGSSNSIAQKKLISLKTSVKKNKFSVQMCPNDQSHSNVMKVIMIPPTGCEIDEQGASYDNTTMSSVLLESRTHLELVWNGESMLNVCHTITANCPWLRGNTTQGIMYILSFDTKIVEDVQSY